MAPHADTQVLAPASEAKLNGIAGPTATINGKPVAVKPSTGKESQQLFNVKSYARVTNPTKAKQFPFPTDLRELAGWAEVFVEKLGVEAINERNRQKDYEAEKTVLRDIIRRRDDEYEKLKAILRELKRENDILTTTNADQASRLQAQQHRIDDLLIEAKAREELISKLYDQIRDKSREIDGLKKERDFLKEEIKALAILIQELDTNFGIKDKRYREIIAELKKTIEKERGEDLLEDQAYEATIKALKDELQTTKKSLGETVAARDQLQKEFNDAKAEIASLESKLRIANDSHEATLKELAEAIKKLDEVSRQRDGLEGQVQVLQGQVSAVKDKLTTAEAEIVGLHGELRTANSEVEKARQHSRQHFQKLEDIRVKGEWFNADGFSDPCQIILPVAANAASSATA